MTRFTSVAAALALVLSGMAVGSLATFLLMSRPRRDGPPPPPPPPPFSRALEDRLGLTEEQRRKVETILEEGRREGEAIRREVRPRLEQQIDAVRGRIEAVLDPEQREKFREMVREDRRRAERFLIEGARPPEEPPPAEGPPPRRDPPPPR